ncbi:hypothetical protein SAMN05443668_108295 [Cryptosporangium aurantiacum]|uniref:DNA-binding transcriptional regulator of glucitol operon n=1 Tax=Cryptosporangium aurantiacum TaxID=134849 RepID=A0A1M7R933_9ACTN|nr:hypothetical protein SAMN05443668_108295 [Cryptosporangium aurantiacum]
MAIVLIGVFLGLAWWQWGRAQSLTGSAQNIGYALQWPAFAAFVCYVWYRMLRIELRPTAESDPPQTNSDDAAPRPRTVQVRRHYRPTTAEPAEPSDEQLDAYNAYLATLNAPATPPEDPAARRTAP